MRNTRIILVALLAILPFRVHADEGMWLLSMLEQLNMEEMHELGLELSAEDIYSLNQASLKDAIGALDHGSCTAELVSPDGLLLTNHHCAYDEIQFHSSVEADYLKKGFWAMSREEELPNEGKSITFLIRMEEVTAQILSELNERMDEQARAAKIRSLSAKISKKATEGSSYEARVRSMYGGNRFFLFVTETYKDVRLVGAPPESIGKYGGDTDNWVWPRHTGDFAMFRVYTGPDGKPAEYHPDNIPLKSKHFLPVSLKGYAPGDFTMIMGYPGRTNRYISSWEVGELLDVSHPNRILIRGEKLKLQREDMNADERVRLQYASKYASASNYYKYSIGQSKGLLRLDVMGKKQAEEEAFRQWISEDPERAKAYDGVLEEIEMLVAKRRELSNAYQYLYETMGRGRGMESVYFARNLEAFSKALSKSVDEPEAYQKALESLQSKAALFYKDYNPDTDRRVMLAMIKLLRENVEEEYLPECIKSIEKDYKGDAEKYVENYFKKSMLVDQERFKAFLASPSWKSIEKDPAYQAYIDSKLMLEVSGKLNEMNRESEWASRLYMRGRMEMQKDRVFYSDANSTLRLTYGTVGDYQPRDAVTYDYFTTLTGVMEKEDPANFEFTVPEKLKELYEQGDYGKYAPDGELHVCFISNNDITGGNSGSPIMNARGELLGLAFDGNWEAMSGDIAFETAYQKTINVDIRYVLFIIDKFAGAGHLVEEMTLMP